MSRRPYQKCYTRQPWVKVHPKPKARFNLEEQEAYLNRIIGRANRAAGYDTTKAITIWEYAVTLDGKTHEGTVYAYNRSEARAKIKLELKIPKRKRLPVGIKLERFNVED